MNIVHKKGIKMDGTHPTRLFGYGGFDDLELPNFAESAAIFIWHFNGIYAVPNIRGGG
jgi:prolyl oligopeptidase